MGNSDNHLPPYRKKFDSNGNYLPFPGYTIVAHAQYPLPESLINLVDYLSSSELRNFYSFLPKTSYHVTINPLEGVHDQHQTLLAHKQHQLEQVNTSLVCTAEKLLCSDIIAIEVQFDDDRNPNFNHILKTVRSDDLQSVNILHHYTKPWHLSLAYRYKSIDDETNSKLRQIIKTVSESSKFPFDILLKHVRICHYNDMTEFTPV